MDAMNSNVGKINSLQAQIQELHHINDHLAQASIQSQVVEPEFKRIKVALDDYKMTLLEVKERMKDQEHAHRTSLARLNEQVQKQQEDIRYLLKKTRSMGDPADDQPRRTDLRAASGMSEVSPAPRADTVNPHTRVLQPALLLPNTATGSARERPRTRPPARDQPSTSASSQQDQRLEDIPLSQRRFFVEEEKHRLEATKKIKEGKSSQELSKEAWERKQAAQADQPPTSDEEEGAGKSADKSRTDDEKKRSTSQTSVRSNRSTTSLRARSV